MKPFDLIRIKADGHLAIINTVTFSQGIYQCSAQNIDGGNKVAWFYERDFDVISNLTDEMVKMIANTRCSGIPEYSLKENVK